MTLGARCMERATAYRLWQAPFAERKLAPVLRHNDVHAVSRVLDVGCGPGTNTQHFRGSEYVGLDINPDYIAEARRRHGRDFRVADVTVDPLDGGDQRYDFVMLNSFLHHLDTASARRLLARLRDVVAEGGHVHVLDLVLPERPSVARWLARHDRGDYPRRLEEWRELFEEPFEPVVFEPYQLGAGGLTLWQMVYFKGTTGARAAQAAERDSQAEAN